MLRPLIILSVILIAALRGGKISNFANLHLRWIPLAIAAFVLQLLIFTPLLATPLLPYATTQLYMLSMAMLTIWVALNWRTPGMWLMAAGLLMNTAAIVANGGYMPTPAEYALAAGKIGVYDSAQINNNSVLRPPEDVKLWLFTDILVVPSFIPLANVFSIGDVVLTLGIAVLCYQTMMRGGEAQQKLAGVTASSVAE